MNDSAATRKRKIVYRAHHRGFKEADLLVGGFVDRYIDSLNDGQLDRLEALLEEPDSELYAWIVGAEPVPTRHDNDVMVLMADYDRYLRP